MKPSSFLAMDAKCAVLSGFVTREQLDRHDEQQETGAAGSLLVALPGSVGKSGKTTGTANAAAALRPAESAASSNGIVAMEERAATLTGLVNAVAASNGTIVEEEQTATIQDTGAVNKTTKEPARAPLVERASTDKTPVETTETVPAQTKDAGPSDDIQIDKRPADVVTSYLVDLGRTSFLSNAAENGQSSAAAAAEAGTSADTPANNGDDVQPQAPVNDIESLSSEPDEDERRRQKQAECKLRKKRIRSEVADVLQQVRETELEPPEDPGEDVIEKEAVDAIYKAAFQLCYRKKYYNVFKDEFVYFPTLTSTILNYSLFEEAEKHYYDEEDEFPMEYSAAIRSYITAKAAEDETDKDGTVGTETGEEDDEDYMNALATELDLDNSDDDDSENESENVNSNGEDGAEAAETKPGPGPEPAQNVQPDASAKSDDQKADVEEHDEERRAGEEAGQEIKGEETEEDRQMKREERKKRKLRILDELTKLLKKAEDEELEYDADEEEDCMENESVEALQKAAMKICYLKKYYDVFKDEFIYFPSVSKAIMNYTLIEEAEKYYFDEEDEFPMEYSAALRSVVTTQAIEEEANHGDTDGIDDNEDEDYMAALAMDLDLEETESEANDPDVEAAVQQLKNRNKEKREAAAAEAKERAELAAKIKAEEEAEKARLEAETQANKKAAEEAEKARLEAEAEDKRKAEEEAEAKRKAEEEAEKARLAAQTEAAAKKKAEEEAAAEEAVEAEKARRVAEAEAAKKKAEEEAAAAKKKAEAEAAARKAEEEAEAAKKKAEAEAAANRKAEEDAREARLVAEAAAKQKAEEAERTRLAAIRAVEEKAEIAFIQKKEKEVAEQTKTGPVSRELPSAEPTEDGCGNGKKLVMLISNSSGHRVQLTNQQRVLTLFQSKGIKPELVDGSDPSNKQRRNELFAISGIRGNYPQCFVVDGENTSFLGNSETIEGMNDDGTLTVNAIFGNSRESSSNGSSAKAASAGDTPASTTPEPSSTTGDKQVLVMLSTSSGDRTQTTNQNRVMAMFEACGIKPETLDAADPSNKDRRSELFGVSGIRGNYPQVFVVDGGQTSFLGNFETVESMYDAGTLKWSVLGPSSSDDTEDKNKAAETLEPGLSKSENKENGSPVNTEASESSNSKEDSPSKQQQQQQQQQPNATTSKKKKSKSKSPVRPKKPMEEQSASAENVTSTDQDTAEDEAPQVSSRGPDLLSEAPPNGGVDESKNRSVGFNDGDKSPSPDWYSMLPIAAGVAVVAVVVGVYLNLGSA